MALPQAHRLRDWRAFQAVHQQGSRDRSLHLLLRALAIADKTQPVRVGVSVSRKVSKKAVVRNRLKRQILAGLQALLPRLARGWQLVIVVRPAASECEYKDFLRELEQLLSQAGLFNGD
ncbi:MAG: ribonuclease P protein component [Chloroflexaceae bacterium]|nr:ribonuclease P protein component [Chloroflexaceae bacterium]